MNATLPTAPPTLPPAPDWVIVAALLDAPPAALAWMTEPGLLTERVQRRCPDSFGLRIVAQRQGLLEAADAACLGVGIGDCFVREIELCCGTEAVVFAQTLVPLPMLAAEPWLAELGQEALGPRLARSGHARREPLEFARLAPGHALYRRAWRTAASGPDMLWARRARYTLGSHSLVVQEVFMPGSLS